MIDDFERVRESRVQTVAQNLSLAYPAITLLVASIGAGIIDSLFSPVDHNPL